MLHLRTKISRKKFTFPRIDHYKERGTREGMSTAYVREELTQEKGVPVVRARSFCLNELAMLGISGPIFADQAAERPRPEAPAMRSRHLFPYLNWHLLSDPVHHPTNEKASTVRSPGSPPLLLSHSPSRPWLWRRREERAFVGRGNRIRDGIGYPDGRGRERGWAA